MRNRQGDSKCRAFVGLAFGIDISAVPFDNLPTGGKADPSPFVFAPAMKTLDATRLTVLATAVVLVLGTLLGSF